MMHVKDLYDEFELEREKLNHLVVNALENNQPFASNDTIVMQSRKVDLIVEKITKLGGQTNEIPPAALAASPLESALPAKGVGRL